MKNLLAAGALMALIAVPAASRAEDITRFAPLKAEQLTPPQKAWADEIAVPPRNAKFGNPPYRAYIRNPDLAPRLSALSDYLRWNTSLPPRLSELAILITAREWTAQYEWFAHAPMAAKGGVDPKTIEDLRRGRVPRSMPKDERAIYDFIQELYKTKRVGGRTYKRVQSLLGDTATVELVGILGYYVLISMTLNIFQMLPPESEKLAFSE